MATIVRDRDRQLRAGPGRHHQRGGGEGERRAAQDARHARIIARLTSTRRPHNAYDFGVGSAVSAFTAMACQ
jgi:hypothetical protein